MRVSWVNAMRRRLRFRDEQHGERGNVTLLTAFSIMVISGFSAMVTDVGGLYLQKQTAQSGADAGALAGADVLLQAGASSAANTAFQMAKVNDTKSQYTVTADSTTQTVTVQGQQSVPLWFARIWGMQNASVHVTSQASIGTLTSGTGMVPIAVPEQSFVYGQQYTLSDGAGTGQSGNYGFLDLSGNGANGVESDIEHGYNFPLSVGEQVSTKPGVMSGPVQQAIDYRMSEDGCDTGCENFSNAKPDCARVIYLPVVDSLDVSGKKDVTIMGFAAFYLNGLQNGGGHQQIVGRFIQMVRPGTIGNGQNFGAYGVKLLAP